MRNFSKNKKSEEKRKIMTPLYLNTEDKKKSKRIYTREPREEKESMS